MVGSAAVGAALAAMRIGFRRDRRIWAQLLVLVFSAGYLAVLSQTTTSVPMITHEEFPAAIDGLGEKRGCECWEPVWASPAAFTRSEPVLVESRDTVIRVWEAEKREFTVGEGEAREVRVATFYYPHWKATVNDEPVTVKRDADGSILIPVGEPESSVILTFREPLMFQVALFVSILTWSGLIMTLIYVGFAARTRSAPSA